MNDAHTTVAELKRIVKEFVDERDWNQFHTPKNLSMKLALEVAELMEHFTWLESRPFEHESEKSKRDIEAECADVLIMLLAFANACSIDLSHVFVKKLTNAKAKYPVEKCKGKSDKYTTYLENKSNKS
jgi:dCTP diphosphatase